MSRNGITIRHALLGDRDRILAFIRDHWKQDHIFVVQPELFDYYHVIDGKLTFVIAEDENTKKIYGLQGYIASNRSPNPDVWGAIWKIIPTPVPYPFMGIEIMKHIRSSSSCRIFAGVGANPRTTIPLIQFLKEKTGKMDHYYRISDRSNYRIAEIHNRTILPLTGCADYNLVEFLDMDDLRRRFDIERYNRREPYKDDWYLKRRYYEHPVYRYRVYGIDKGSVQIDSILVMREQEHHDAKILRIVDFIGIDTDLCGIGRWIQNVMEERQYEYVDCYCKGISQKIMEQAGFVLRNREDPNIIPNYFEPFVRENIDVYYHSTDDDGFYVFKADADQDRPSMKADRSVTHADR